MTIKLYELLNVEKPISELLNQNLPIKLSWRLSKLVKEISLELKEFNELRDKMIKQLGKESEPGKQDWSISPEDKEAIGTFQEQIQELVNVDADIRDFEPISINEFNGTDIKISPVQMASLQVFFKD
jgi:hypothetical protein